MIFRSSWVKAHVAVSSDVWIYDGKLCLSGSKAVWIPSSLTLGAAPNSQFGFILSSRSRDKSESFYGVFATLIDLLFCYFSLFNSFCWSSTNFYNSIFFLTMSWFSILFCSEFYSNVYILEMSSLMAACWSSLFYVKSIVISSLF